MKVRNLMLTCALALTGILAACNENPVVEPGNAPANIGASSKSSTAVTINWDAVSGATSYNLSWAAVAPATGSGSTTGITATEAVVTGLSEGVQYDFTVTATTASGTGNPSVVRWAAASRATETGNSGGPTNTQIRMYEFDSPKESGLNLNIGGKPMRVSMVVGSPNQAQLAMYVYDKTPATADIDSVIIGPAYAMVEYRAAHLPASGKIDETVFISTDAYAATSLDSWFLSSPLNTFIDPQGNIKAYKFVGNPSIGQGFMVRTGTVGAYHYARVVVKPVNGMIVSGNPGGRYVELEISYQNGIDVPFAKAGMPEAQKTVRATTGHRRIVD